VIFGTRLNVVWDDPPTSVSGTLVAWIDDPGRRGSTSPVLELDDPFTAEGALGDSGVRGTVTGRFLVLSARYSGHDWDSEEGIVHATLFRNDPRRDGAGGVWVADHAVYKPVFGASD
jgi:hypothetical protein